MQSYFLVPILILIVGIAACSQVTTNLEAHALGETMEQVTVTVQADSEDISLSSEDAAPTLPESSPKVPTQENIPEQETTPETFSEQDVAPKQAQDTAPEQHIEPLPTMPIITETHQGYTYRPGQVVAVLAEGFEDDDTLAVTLVHEDQGQVDTHFVSPVSSRGNIPIYLPVEIDEADIYPDGKYTFRVSGSNGSKKVYAFSLDFLNPAEPAPFDGCGMYPEPMLDSIVFVWCTGHAPSAAPLDIRGVVNGEELFSDVVDTIYSDGVALYILDIFDDDPAGEWMLEIGQDELTFDVSGETHE